MILALDESGDFRADSRRPHFFVAVHVRQGKEPQHAAWEQSIPRRLKAFNGEFKGATLPELYLRTFLRDVLGAAPPVRITPVVVVPAIQSLDHLQRHRDYSVATIMDSQLQMGIAGNRKGAAQVAQLAGWLRRMSLSHYLKLNAMVSCVGHSLRDAIGQAISGRYDLELPHLQFKIDRDFVRNRIEQEFWIQVLRAYMRAQFVGDESLFSLDVWERTGHPFLDLYARRLPDGDTVWDFTKLFRERTSFLPSKLHFELRIADVVVAIMRRYYTRRDCRELYPRLVDLFCGRVGPVHHVVLGGPPGLQSSRGGSP